MPYFYGSLKVAITLAFVGTTVSEMTAANEGIGYLLISAGSSMQMGLGVRRPGRDRRDGDGHVRAVRGGREAHDGLGAPQRGRRMTAQRADSRARRGQTARVGADAAVRQQSAHGTAAPPPADARTEPTAAQVVAMLERAQALARRAMDAGHHPFGALLVAADHETVLIEQGNVDSVNHAEAVLARDAARRYSPAELWGCTLVTTVEPCAMCAGTQYWANIGRARLRHRGAHAARADRQPRREPDARPAVPPRFARGQKDVRVIGPVAAVAEPIAAMHKRYWRSR